MAQSISSLPSIFWRHRWPAIATFVSVICGSLAYLAITPPKYEATMRVMLDDNQLSVSEIDRALTNYVKSLVALPNK